MTKFLLIDDNPGDRALIVRQLNIEFSSCQVEVITNQEEFNSALETDGFDLVITDFLLHWSDGITILQAVKANFPGCPVIMFTASGSQEIAVEAMKSGLDDYLIKSPSQYVRVPISVRSMLQMVAERDRNQQLFNDYQTIQKQVEQLERLNRLKDDFLNMVSHELRTPITNMKMAIRMLNLMPTEEQRQRYLKILATECDREAELVDNLLDLQRLEALPDAMTPRELGDMQEWLPGLIDSFRGRVQERQQIFQVELPTFPPLNIDHPGLKRVLAELLNNACKYTAANSEISLTGTLEVTPAQASSEANRTLTLTIRNQAEIPAIALPHVFDKFYRVPKSDHWKQGGTGLGLALARELVNRMNGVILVTSEEGWTTFTVRLDDV